MAHSLFSAAKRPMGVDALQYDFVAAVNTHAHLATVYWLQGFIARSATSHAHALQNARQLGQPFVVASALYFSLVRKALCRDYVAMAPIARELQALSEEIGFPSFGPFSKFFVGCVLVAERRSIDDGLSLMREGTRGAAVCGTQRQSRRPSRDVGQLSSCIDRRKRAAKSISRPQWSGGFGAHSGPSRGDGCTRALRPERSSDFRARTIPSDVVRKSALASSVGTLRFQLAYCSTLFETGLAGNRAVNMMPDLSNAAYRDERQNS